MCTTLGEATEVALLGVSEHLLALRETLNQSTTSAALSKVAKVLWNISRLLDLLKGLVLLSREGKDILVSKTIIFLPHSDDFGLQLGEHVPLRRQLGSCESNLSILLGARLGGRRLSRSALSCGVDMGRVGLGRNVLKMRLGDSDNVPFLI